MWRNLRWRREAELTTPPSGEGEQDDFQAPYGDMRRRVAIKNKMEILIIPGKTEPAVEIRDEDPGEQWRNHLMLHFIHCLGEG